MKGLLLLIAVLAGVAFGYPLAGEGTTSSCDALERVTLRVVAVHDKDVPTGGVMLGTMLQGLSHGQFAAVAAKDRYPSLPPAVACTVLYLARRAGYRRLRRRGGQAALSGCFGARIMVRAPPCRRRRVPARRTAPVQAHLRRAGAG